MPPIKGFIKGATAVIQATVRQSEAPFDPDTVVLTTLKRGSVNVLPVLPEDEFTREGTGLWQLHIDTGLLEPGIHTLVVTGTSGNDVALTKDTFTVLPLP